mgnify:CR=1 FL=1
MNLNQNRRTVKGYRDSEIMTGTRNQDVKAKTYTPPVKNDALNMNVSSRAAIPPKNPGISIK